VKLYVNLMYLTHLAPGTLLTKDVSEVLKRQVTGKKDAGASHSVPTPEHRCCTSPHPFFHSGST
jgi:hypothetical protein